MTDAALTPTPEMLALAREIAIRFLQSRGFTDMSDAIRVGCCDSIPEVECALAAIIATTERAAAFLDQQCPEADIASDAAVQALWQQYSATALRSAAHLKDPS